MKKLIKDIQLKMKQNPNKINVSDVFDYFENVIDEIKLTKNGVFVYFSDERDFLHVKF